MTEQIKLSITTPGRGIIDITNEISQVVKTKVKTGICNIFLHHTSASLILCENADPSVRRDLEAFIQRLIPDGDSLFTHKDEGPDDMPSHIRTMLTSSFLTVPIIEGKLGLGTWQGIYLWEHRIKGHQRKITVTILG